MYTFILSLLIVSFISLCFFKKRFWENRYLVLLISASVAIVVTLSTNYITRGKLGTNIETIRNERIIAVKLNPSLVDSTIILTKDKNLDFSQHFINANDSTKTPISSHYLFYYDDGSLKVGFATGSKYGYKYWNTIYIAPSENDSIAYFTKERQYYNKRSSKWITDFSLPFIKTINCLYIPPSEYAAIPDSLIRKIPI